MDKQNNTDITDICVVVLKWDAFEFGKKLEVDIIGTTTEWLKSFGLHVLAVHYISSLSGEQIDQVYATHLDKPFYPSLRSTLLGTPAVAMIIGGKGGVADKVKHIKGDPDTEGSIRWQWSYKREFEKSPDFNDWLNKKGKYADPVVWQDIQYKIYRDTRIHSSATDEETRRNCKALFQQSMLQDITERYPNVVNLIEL